MLEPLVQKKEDGIATAQWFLGASEEEEQTGKVGR